MKTYSPKHQKKHKKHQKKTSKTSKNIKNKQYKHAPNRHKTSYLTSTKTLYLTRHCARCKSHHSAYELAIAYFLRSLRRDTLASFFCRSSSSTREAASRLSLSFLLLPKTNRSCAFSIYQKSLGSNSSKKARRDRGKK